MTPLINNPPNQSIIIKHEPTISPPEKAIKTFACNICDQLFTRKDKLKRHIENIHMKERPFSCNHCSFKCYRRDRIKKHMMSEHVNHPNDFMYQPCNIHIDLSAHSITPTVDGNVNASPQTIPLVRILILLLKTRGTAVSCHFLNRRTTCLTVLPKFGYNICLSCFQ